MVCIKLMGKVTIKGKNFLGFEIEINSNSIDEIKKELDIVLSSSAHLLKNTLLTLKLTESNKIFADKIVSFISDKNIDINAVVVQNKNGCNIDIPIIETKDIHFLKGEGEKQTASYRGNLRNGQTVRADGDVIIAGNANANSYIYATGNIFILGKLNGIAHAGYGGNNDAIIFAFNLNPPQIRIGDLITRSPEEKISMKSNKIISPEVAYVNDNSIIISSYEEWIKLKD